MKLMREGVLVDGVGGDVADEQRVAVGGRFRNGFQSEIARCPRTVFHEDALAKGFGELGGHDPGDDVGRAARGVGNEDLYRSGRKGVGRLRGGRERQGGEGGGQDARGDSGQDATPGSATACESDHDLSSVLTGPAL